MNESTTTIPSRREFAQALAVLAVATAPATAQEAAPPDAKAFEAALDTIVRYQFSKHLSEEQLKKVQAAVVRRRQGSDQLKKVVLANGDDPIVAFRADLP
jgi:hypothetical protein